MKSAVPGRLVATVAISILALTGCQEGQEPSTEASTPSAGTDVDVPSRSTSPAPETRTAPSYTDPSKADTYCEAIADLAQLNDEAAEDDEEATIGQMGDRLDLLVSGTAHISKLAPNQAAEEEWKAVSDDYSEATNLFKSSGGQVSNTDFLVLLSDATQTANSTYRHQADSVKEKCGVDITKLIAEEKQ
ncbi:hypothetical protein [Brevibacterium aurantiacum]|uniref:Lipoprotein n=1 Tax=Brevibacterium aurantiacum TaxID=273384 RepID=A0A556C9J3_BREAU|nr:hypothetical protein [Brevibacterium aurantiacum]TSI14071.1 hypothetical protein FO013_15040 [Brevibacterium aurantiacum]